MRFKVILCIVVVILAVSLSGCGEKLGYARVTTVDGIVIEGNMVYMGDDIGNICIKTISGDEHKIDFENIHTIERLGPWKDWRNAETDTNG